MRKKLENIVFIALVCLALLFLLISEATDYWHQASTYQNAHQGLWRSCYSYGRTITELCVKLDFVPGKNLCFCLFFVYLILKYLCLLHLMLECHCIDFVLILDMLYEEEAILNSEIIFIIEGSKGLVMISNHEVK